MARIFLIFSFLLVSVYGSEREYLQKFLKNYRKKNLFELEYQSRLLEKDFFFASKNASIYMDAYESTDKTERNNNFQIQGKKKYYELGVKKDFSTGTSLDFKNILVKNELSGPSFILSNPNFTEFSQKITLSQDIGANYFGNLFFKELKIKDYEIEMGQVAKNKKFQGELFLFYEKYLNLALFVKYLDLQNEALKRAEKRLRITVRRVRDGLRRKVDQMQSRSNLLAQKDQLNDLNFNLIKTKNSLEELIGPEILLDNIYPLREITGPREISRFETNLDLKELNLRLEVLKKNLERDRLLRWPKIKAYASYLSNDINRQTSEAMSEGHLGKDHYEKIIGVNLVWEIGNESTGVKKKITHNNLRILNQRKKLMLDGLSRELTNLNNQIKNFMKKREINQSIVNLKRKTLKSLGRDYDLGNIEIDRILQAEDELLQSEKKYWQEEIELRLSIARVKYLIGDLPEYLYNSF